MSRRRAETQVPRPAPVRLHQAFRAPADAVVGSAAAQRDADAGLMVLELLDRLRPTVTREQWPTRREIAAAKRALADLGYTAGIRGALETVLDTVADAAIGRARFNPATLLTYARALLNDARWTQAADVYQVYIGSAASPADFALVPEAYQRLAYVLRMADKLDGALAACRMGHAVAMSLGNVAVSLRMRISEANIAKMRGNVEGADEVLAEVVAAAERHRLPIVRAYALHDRGVIAYEAGRLHEAVPQIYDAWLSYDTPAAKDRALADLALALADLGLRDAARDAFMVISQTAVERDIRLAATINLMELASRDREEAVFEEYRQGLAVQKLPPRLEAYFHRTVGEGYQRFGRIEAATAAYDHANDLANDLAARHQVNHVTFQVESATRDLVLSARMGPRDGSTENGLSRVVLALKAATADLEPVRARTP